MSRYKAIVKSSPLSIANNSVDAISVFKNEYLDAAFAKNTKRSYISDIDHFEKSGFTLPATPEHLIIYLKNYAEILNPNTLDRRLMVIDQWHRYQGLKSPKTDIVKKTMVGIHKVHGKKRQKAVALKIDTLKEISEHLSERNKLIDLRNNALLLLGLFGALRRSEAVALRWEDIEFASGGIVINIPRSKTDRYGKGESVSIPYKTHLKPAEALIEFRRKSKITSGPIFRKISSASNISSEAISDHTLNCLIKELVERVGEPNWKFYSGHSLRRGFATESARLGASLEAIKRHGRWKSVKTVLEYIEEGRQFEDNAANIFSSNSM